MANKDTQDRINALVTEEQLQKSIATQLISKRKSQTVVGEITKKLVDDLKSQIGVENKLETVLKTKQTLLEGGLKLSKNKAKLLLKELEIAEELLKKEKKRADKTAEIKELLDGTTDSLLESLGLSKEMFKNGVMFGLGMLAAKKGAEMLTAAFESTVGLAKELYHHLGTTAAESARIGVEVGKASFSMIGFLHGSEALATSAKDIAGYFNSTAMISSESLQNVTELNALMEDGAGAVRMNAIMESTGEHALHLTHSIKDIANKSGVTAAAVFKEMDAQAGKLLGKSEKELEIIAKQTAAMVKLGVTKENLMTVSDSVLDIENSITAQNKARLFGVEMNTQAIRDAAMAYKYGGGSAEDFAKAISEQVGSAEEFGNMAPGIQEIYASQIGMTTDQITDMLLKQEELRKNTEKYGEDGAKAVAAIGTAFDKTASFASSTIPLLASTSMLMNNLGMNTQSFGKSIGGAFSKLKEFVTSSIPFFKKSPISTLTETNVNPLDTSKTKGANVKGKGGSTIGKTIGSLGSGVGTAMKGIAKGFAAFATPQVILGVAVITGAMIGLGFALKLAAPGIEAIGKAIATVIGGIGDFITKIATPETANGLLHLAPAFAALGLSFLPLAIGLAAITPVLPTLVALVALGAGIALIANALNGEGASETTTSNTTQSDPLLEEIRGLRADIKSQPINVVLNGKIVGEINKGSRAINSYVNK